jgi:hypothetical protein
LMQIDNSTKIGKINFQRLIMKLLRQINPSTKIGKINF